MEISVAKFRLYNSSPFWGSIIFNLPVKIDETVLTAGVDGKYLYVNPLFWDKLSNREQLGVLCHEVGHLFLGHLWRRKNRVDMCVDPTTGQTVMLWNLAADVVVNNMILKENKFDLPKGCFVRPELDNKSTEEVYEILKKQIPKMSKKELKNLIDSMYNDKSKWSKSKGKNAKDDQAKWKNIGKQALEHARQQDKLPAGFERLFDETQPKEDWRQVLINYIQPYSNDYSFNPVDRRFLDEEFALPDIQQGQQIDWLAVAIDTSGSIGQVELNAFVGEIKAILGSFDKVKIRLTFCDARASEFVELDEYDPAKVKVTGGGGTDFRPVFNLIEKEPTNPVALVYFTDLYGDFPAEAPYYDVIWINTSIGQQAPFGKNLNYEI